MTIETPTEYTYNTAHLTVLDSTDLVFKVATEDNALLALSVIPGVYDVMTYEIAIGETGNRLVQIRDGIGGAILAHAEKYGLLDRDELRSFWISWGSGRVSVGQGSTVGEEELVSVMDVNLSFTTVAVSTDGWKGTWQFNITTPDLGKAIWILFRFSRTLHGLVTLNKAK